MIGMLCVCSEVRHWLLESRAGKYELAHSQNEALKIYLIKVILTAAFLCKGVLKIWLTLSLLVSSIV